MDEAPKEVILWAEEKQTNKKNCNAGHSSCVYAYVSSKEEATILFREVRGTSGDNSARS